MEDGLQVARLVLLSCLKSYDPSRGNLKNFFLIVLERRLREVLRFRSPFSVSYSAVEKKIKVPSSFPIDEDVDILDPSSGIEDEVVKRVFLEQFRKDVQEIISSPNAFTDKERELILKYLKGEEKPLRSTKPWTLEKIKHRLQGRGYSIEDIDFL